MTTPAPKSQPPILINPEDYQQTRDVLYDSVLRLWDVVENLSRLQPRRSDNYHACIFGSARVHQGMSGYDDIVRLAEQLARLGCYIVTGGGPGLMQAANEGALRGAPDHPERSVGIRIDLEFEQESNPFVGEVYKHKTFFARLHHFVLRSNAFIVVPGGIGTTLELMMIWQLLQVRKLYRTPLILVGSMWPELVGWAEKQMVRGEHLMASELDMTIPSCVPTIEEALKIVSEDYKLWKQGESEQTPGNWTELR